MAVPLCIASMRFVTATSSANDAVGFWTIVTLYLSLLSRTQVNAIRVCVGAGTIPRLAHPFARRSENRGGPAPRCDGVNGSEEELELGADLMDTSCGRCKSPSGTSSN